MRNENRSDEKKDNRKEKRSEKDSRKEKRSDKEEEIETENEKRKTEKVQKEKRNGEKKHSERDKCTEKEKRSETENETEKEKEKRKTEKVKEKVQKEKGNDVRKDNKKGEGIAKEREGEKVKATRTEKDVEEEEENVNEKRVDKGEKVTIFQSNDCDMEVIEVENERVNEENNENVDKSIQNITEIKAKRTISLQEYTQRNKEIQANDLEVSVHDPLPLDNIMAEMSKTFPVPSCVSPIRDRDETPEPQSPPPPSPTTDDEETMRAVASICVEDSRTILLCNEYDNEPDIEVELANNWEDTYTQDISHEILEGVVMEIIRNDVEVVLARKEEKKQRRAEKRKRKAEKAVERNLERESTDAEVRKKIKRNEMLAYLKASQDNRVLLNIGGTRFETSESTLKQDPESLFFLLFSKDTPNRDNYFIDRDPAHFRLILNYLRCGCSLPSESVLPRELRYLLEVKSECEFYNLQGLKDIVDTRLRRFSEPGFPN